MSTYEQAGSPGVQTPGHDCKHCGQPGFEHDKKRVTRGNGRYGYRLWCPGAKPGGDD